MLVWVRMMPHWTNRLPLWSGRELTVALQSHGNDAHGFAQPDLRGLQAGRGRSFLLHVKLTVLLRDLVSYLLPLLFQILHGSAGAGLLENADGFVRRILGLLQDLAGLFVGLPQDLIAGLVDALLLLLQPLFSASRSPFYRIRSPAAPFQWSRGSAPGRKADPQSFCPPR